MAPFVPRRRSPAVAIVRIAASRRVPSGGPHPCVGRYGLSARRPLRPEDYICTYGGLLRLHDDERPGAHLQLSRVPSRRGGVAAERRARRVASDVARSARAAQSSGRATPTRAT